MGACLAMPGPVPAAWLAARGHGKDTIRATILVMFVVAYSIALVLQAGMAGIEPATLRHSAMLAPATLAGLVIGRLLGGYLSERVYRWLLGTVLTITAGLLFLSPD